MRFQGIKPYPVEEQAMLFNHCASVKSQRSKQQFRSCPIYIFSLKSEGLTVKSLGELAPPNPLFFLALCWHCFTHASVLCLSSTSAHYHCFSLCWEWSALMCQLFPLCPLRREPCSTHSTNCHSWSDVLDFVQAHGLGLGLGLF